MFNEYIEKVKQEESSVISIDFDGVIHSFESGFGDGTIYGTPINGSYEALEKLSMKYKLVIYTAKAKDDRPLVNNKTGKELVWEWLKKYNLNTFIHDITAEKPRAIVYIDDKSIRFHTWDQTLKELNSFINKD